MLRLKKSNLTLLLMASPFLIAGCGGASGGDTKTKEVSSSEVAVEITVQPTTADQTISELVSNNTVAKNANWIPSFTTSSTKSFSKSKVSPIGVESFVHKTLSSGTNDTAWKIYDKNPSGAMITSEYNDAKGSDVIKLEGDGIKNGYVLGYSFSKGSTWTDKENKTIKWSMNFSEDYFVYVRVSTPKGYRYLYYTAHNSNYGIAGYDAPHYIHNGLGTTSKNGTWKTFSRDLTADLQRHERDNSITSVDGFFVRGSGLIDDLEVLSGSKHVNEVLYEDSEDGKTTGWDVYDDTPAGAAIINVDDADTSKVIKFVGDSTKNGYRLSLGKNTINKEISWDMKYNENYVVYISVETAKGHRFITYTASPTDLGKQEHGGYTYIHLGLNSNIDGSWQTITRNLEADLKKYEPNNSILSTNAILIRASGKVDNIKMFDTKKAFDDATS